MTKKKTTIISLILFVLIFSGLLITATFTDLQVSKILTASALPKGEYLATDFFGVMFECIGSAPVYIMIAFAIQILFHFVMRFWKKQPIKEIVAMIGLIASTAAYYAWLNEAMGYLLDHFGIADFEAPYITGVLLFISAVFTFFATMAVKNFSDESIKKLVNFAFAVILTVILANVAVALIKSPVGRMRFRAMNSAGGQSIGGFDNFTRWYVVNGQMDKQEMLRLFGTTDACKSFPSGHTCAAGMCYGLIMLIDALGIKGKGKKAALWICTIVFTGTVAVSRIVVGAHFFSDVLMGGTISFVSMIVFREILICKFSHLKALFKKA